jgi:hypothetical protein
MKSTCILFATALTGAACSHAQPPPPPAPVEPSAQLAPPPPAPPPETAPAPVLRAIEIVATSVYFEFDLALGQRRADAAKTYLVNLGLDASRIATISYGKERPRALGHDEASWRENRRADLMAATQTVSQVSR